VGQRGYFESRKLYFLTEQNFLYNTLVSAVKRLVFDSVRMSNIVLRGR
jgi:hypothetical protein